MLGQYDQCAQYLRISLTAVEEQYGRYSIEMANELNKFTDVLFELANDRDDRVSILQDLKKHLQDASFIYQIHYGVWSESFREIADKMDRLAALETAIGFSTNE